MTRPIRFLPAAIALACICALSPPSRVLAQVPAPAAAPANTAYSAADLETLVGPFALYPDDLVAVILPASTFPLQVVQADRFLDKRKGNPKLPIDEGWDDSVKALVNYPEVVKKMSADLDWTEALGAAVAANTEQVMQAVQTFRRKVQSAGNLKSDDKQVVTVQQEVITIAPANPEVIYVPQYAPSQVVVAGAPYYYPYSAPYPVYYYPYAPGAALAAGIVWGAAMGAIWGGGRYGANYGGGNNNITINRGNNNVNTGNINRGDRGGGRGNAAAGGGSSTWKPQPRSSQAGGSGTRTGGRVGDVPGGGANAGARPATRDQGGGAFGGGDGGATQRASTRGQESRGGGGSGFAESRGSAGGSSGFSQSRGGGGGAAAAPRTSGAGPGASFGGGGGGGGARASGGGGGMRGGGGGGRGGGGRR